MVLGFLVGSCLCLGWRRVCRSLLAIRSPIRMSRIQRGRIEWTVAVLFGIGTTVLALSLAAGLRVLSGGLVALAVMYLEWR